MKSALGVTAILLATVLCGSQSEPKSTSACHYPDDKSAIRSQEPPKPYKGAGLPEGTVSVLTKYRQPGLRVRRPEGVGSWEFESAAKLYYHGKLFAVVGTAKGLNGKGDGYLGYVTSMVIYDEDGDGNLESPINVNDKKGLFLFHLPGWVTR